MREKTFNETIPGLHVRCTSSVYKELQYQHPAERAAREGPAEFNFRIDDPGSNYKMTG
jgi:hypothetical protein